MYFSAWIFSLNIIMLKFILVVSLISSFFLLLSIIVLYIHVTHLSIHLLMNTWVVSNFQLLQIKPCYKYLCSSLCVDVYFHLPQVNIQELSVHMQVGIWLNFLRSCQTVFQNGCNILHSHQHCYESPSFSISSPAFVMVVVVQLLSRVRLLQRHGL